MYMQVFYKFGVLPCRGINGILCGIEGVAIGIGSPVFRSPYNEDQSMLGSR